MNRALLTIIAAIVCAGLAYFNLQTNTQPPDIVVEEQPIPHVEPSSRVKPGGGKSGKKNESKAEA